MRALQRSPETQNALRNLRALKADGISLAEAASAGQPVQRAVELHFGRLVQCIQLAQNQLAHRGRHSAQAQCAGYGAGQFLALAAQA